MRSVVLLGALLTTSTVAAAGEIDVYLLGGQSNMAGNGLKRDLPSNFPRKIPHTFFMVGKSFVPLTLDLQTSNRPEKFGPEMGFGLEMATEECPVYLVKYGASGQPLHHGWSGSNWVGGQPTRSEI